MATTRLNNQLMLRGLEIFAREFQKSYWLWLNESARAAYNAYLPKLLLRHLSLRHSQVVRVELRHSSQVRGDFNILLSDIDVSIVVADGTSDESIRAVFASYESLRGRWLFLGEGEIFCASEFDEKHEIEQRFEELITLLRTLRKIDWVKPDDRPYHRLKYERSQSKIKQRLRRLTDPKYFRDLSALAPGLDAAISEGTQHNSDSYLGSGLQLLPAPFKRWLYSVVPVQTYEVPAATQAAQLRLALLRHERVQCLAGVRLIEEPAREKEFKNWIQILDGEIQKFENAAVTPA